VPTTWTRNPDVRLRPVPELACCLAYVRRPPELHGLNLTSWLVLSLCDGRVEAAIAKDYFDAVRPVGGPGTTHGAFEGALLQLEALRLIHGAADNAPA
jgi:hypothetical protein